MNRILIAAIAAVSFAGIASAQSIPGSTRVGSSQTETQAPASAGVDDMTTASMTPDSKAGGYDSTVMQDDLHR